MPDMNSSDAAAKAIDSFRPESVALDQIGANACVKILSILGTEKPCFLTNDEGKARAVVLDVHRYHFLMDLIEDQDNGEAQSADNETRTETRQIVRGLLNA